jgi:hypothetical protein
MKSVARVALGFGALFLFVLAAPVLAGTVYKWTDAQGRTYYSDTPIPGTRAERVELPEGPCKEDIDAAQRRSAAEKALEEQRRKELAASRSDVTPPTLALPPLPQNARSEYLTTVGTGILFDPTSARALAQFSLSLRPAASVPDGAYIEARFENPGDARTPLRASKTVERNPEGGRDALILSPSFAGLRCGTFLATVDLYEDASKKRLLGTHQQAIQSRVDLGHVTSVEQFWEEIRRFGKCCP